MDDNSDSLGSFTRCSRLAMSRCQSRVSITRQGRGGQDVMSGSTVGYHPCEKAQKTGPKPR